MQGDEEAFDEFVTLFRPRIFHYAVMMCGQRDDAEEVTQDALMRIFESLGQLREPDRIRAWAFRIAKNACYMKRRRSVFAPPEELSLDSLMPSWRDTSGGRELEIADWSALPEDTSSRGEINDLVSQAVSELPGIYRAVILLRDFEELSTAETAQILDVGEDVVKTRLHRARLAVRQKLDRHFRSVRRVA